MSLTEKEKISYIRKIDFGDIDGYGDPKLDQYFLDDNYWENIVENSNFFVIGRKGTGKSAVYRMIEEMGIERGYIIINSDFGEFPFERLLSLKDDDFARPFQYQTIWKNVILNVLAKAICDSEPIEGDNSNSFYYEIKKYVSECIGNNVIDMHKTVIARTSKNNAGLNFKLPKDISINIGHENQEAFTLGSGENNLSNINSALEELIVSYFMTCCEDRHIIVQFDRLDDNYNRYQNLEQYYQAIISLFKVVYYLNSKFRRQRISGSKIILYLRTDIWNELNKYDSESSRWQDFCLIIDWSISGTLGVVNSKLLKMLNKRIFASFHNNEVNFSTLFVEADINLQIWGRRQDVFQYIVGRTMYRPRDLIQFCKFIQEEVRSSGYLYYGTIKEAEKHYCDWLVNSELANEINPILKTPDPVYKLLKCLGPEPFTMSDFNEVYRSIKGISVLNDVYPSVISVRGITLPSEKLAFYLYDVGIIENIDTRFRPPKYRTSYRNRGPLDRNLEMIIHRGVWKGINV